jgi:type I restriction enzyme S subunit
MSATWPKVKLGEALKPICRPERPAPGKIYRQLGVRLWGQGAYERESIDGASTQYAALYQVEANEIVVNKIWARNGSVAVVQSELAGCFVSGEFPTFCPIQDKVVSRWIHWLSKTQDFWSQCDEKSRGTSGKNRIKPEQFLKVEIPLPPLSEQQRIVARIEELAEQINEARALASEIEFDSHALLNTAFDSIIKNVRWLPMSEVAPLVRRSVEVQHGMDYPELGVRSFGKGSFHKPALTGLEIGNKRLYRIEPGDLVFNNVFAWEGAVAVAKPEDVGRFGSHRFITCVPEKDVVTAEFLCFYFLTSDGLKKLGEASPGGAGRNRTLGLEVLSRIEVPIPAYKSQLWFNTLQSEVNALKHVHAENTAELDALLPSILNKAFKGEL